MQDRKEIKKNGVRNSLLVAPMPTASTAQILGNNECFEPYTSNIYTRRVLSGEFIVVNKHLLEDLVKLGLWTEELKQELMKANGSIQHIDGIPEDIKELYRTVWELKMKDVIDMARHRGYFIDQSQSLNLFMEGATMAKLTSMHFYAWKSGLKTGMYYLRTKSAVAIGTSNGSGMVNKLGIHTSHFKAIAPVVSQLMESMPILDNTKAVSIFQINGAKDFTIPINGGSAFGHNFLIFV